MARLLVRDPSDPRQVSTPLDVNELEIFLKKLGIFNNWSHVIDGLWNGFDVGAKAEIRGQKTIIEPNHSSCRKGPRFISDCIAPETIAGRYSEGCTPQELESRIGRHPTSPLGLIPKPDSFRLI